MGKCEEGTNKQTMTLKDSKNTEAKVALAHGNSRRENVRKAAYYMRSETATQLTDEAIILPRAVSQGEEQLRTTKEAILGVLDELVNFHENELRAFTFRDITIAEGAEPCNWQSLLAENERLEQLPITEKPLYENGPWDEIDVFRLDGSKQTIRVNRRIHRSTFRLAVGVPSADPDLGIFGVLPHMLFAVHPEDRSLIDGLPEQIGRLHGAVEESTDPGSDEWVRKRRCLYRNFVVLARHLLPEMAYLDGTNIIDQEDEDSADQPGFALASDDPVAVDAFLANLVDFPPFSLGHVFYLNRNQFGCGNPDNISTAVGDPDALQLTFEAHSKEEKRREWKDVYLNDEDPSDFEELSFEEEDEAEEEEEESTQSAQDRIKQRLGQSGGDDESSDQDGSDSSGETGEDRDGESAAARIKSQLGDDDGEASSTDEESRSSESADEEVEEMSAAERIKSQMGDDDDDASSNQDGTEEDDDDNEEDDDGSSSSAAEKIKERLGE